MINVLLKLIMLLLDFFKKLDEGKYNPSEIDPNITYNI